MQELKDKLFNSDNKDFLFLLIGFFFLGSFAFAIYSFSEWRDTKSELELTTIEYEKTNQYLQDELDAIDVELSEVLRLNREMSDMLSEEQKKNLELEEEQRDKEEEIEELTKLTTLDPELLKKYSKVYFLSENYVPAKLVDIDKEYLSNPTKIVQVAREVWPFLEDLLEDALRDDMTILIASGYRSFETQKDLKNTYTVQYGAGTANTFSAEQGYSEHQLGTTFDFTTPALNGALNGFDATPEYKWLQDNAYKHGFILSYPKANTFYRYEPWHWRFVGQDLARYLDRQNKFFYELDQRFIDKYLLEIFD